MVCRLAFCLIQLFIDKTRVGGQGDLCLEMLEVLLFFEMASCLQDFAAQDTSDRVEAMALNIQGHILQNLQLAGVDPPAQLTRGKSSLDLQIASPTPSSPKQPDGKEDPPPGRGRTMDRGRGVGKGRGRGRGRGKGGELNSEGKENGNLKLRGRF